jgi:hypothetical protein
MKDIEKIISEAGYNDNFNALMAEAEAFAGDTDIVKRDEIILRALIAIARATVVAEKRDIPTLAREMKAAVGQRLKDKGPMYEPDSEWTVLREAVKANEEVLRYYKTEGGI